LAYYPYADVGKFLVCIQNLFGKHHPVRPDLVSSLGSKHSKPGGEYLSLDGVPDESPYNQVGEPTEDNHFRTYVVMNNAAQDPGHNEVTTGDSGSEHHPLALYTWETGTSDPEHAYQNSEQVVLTFTSSWYCCVGT